MLQKQGGVFRGFRGGDAMGCMCKTGAAKRGIGVISSVVEGVDGGVVDGVGEGSGSLGGWKARGPWWVDERVGSL